MKSYDYYAVAKKIARHLSEAGYTDWSNRLLEAIASGFTATEILMAIRWELKEFKDSQLKVSNAVENEMTELKIKIDAVLK